MGLFEYNQAFPIGEFFVGIGFLIMTLTLSYIIYRIYKKICDYYDLMINKQAKYDILEENCLDKIASKKGIDLDKELRKRNMLKTPTRSFRRKIEDQVYEEMFGKQKEE